MKWAVAITTAPRPNDVSYLPDCLAGLAAAGWESPTVLAEPGSIVPDGCRAVLHPQRLYPWGNFRAALAKMAQESPDADAYAVIQDDAILARNLRPWLESQLWPLAGIGVLSLYSSEASITRWRPAAGWWCLPLVRPGQCHGALAVVLPPGVPQQLLASSIGREGKTQTDCWLGRFCLSTGLAWVQHNPSLVRHIGRVSAIEVPGKAGHLLPRWTTARHEGHAVDLDFLTKYIIPQ